MLESLQQENCLEFKVSLGYRDFNNTNPKKASKKRPTFHHTNQSSSWAPCEVTFHTALVLLRCYFTCSPLTCVYSAVGGSQNQVHRHTGIWVGLRVHGAWVEMTLSLEGYAATHLPDSLPCSGTLAKLFYFFVPELWLKVKNPKSHQDERVSASESISSRCGTGLDWPSLIFPHFPSLSSLAIPQNLCPQISSRSPLA